MEDKNVGINLIIDGISYPLNVPVSEEPYYRQAARLLNEKLILYKQMFTGEVGIRLITMAAIDIAFSHVKQTDNVGSADVMRKIGELSRLIDNTIGKRD